MKHTAKASKSLPMGVELLHGCYPGKKLSYNWYKGLVLVLTFLCYTAYHAARKPPSIVKSVLKGDGSVQKATIDELVGANRTLLSGGDSYVDIPLSLRVGWAPFNGPSGQSLLGEVDMAFLGTYAVGMFFAGHLGDRLDLRYFLTAGMIGSGIFCALFGMGYFWDVHNFSYFIVVSIIAGLFQSTGWPSVVAIVANWFGKGKRGLIMGIWNAHTSVGNILGTVIAAACLASGWGWSFIIPGFIMMGVGVLLFLFLVVQPSDVGLPSPYEPLKTQDVELTETKVHKESEAEGIHFLDAWRIPGVTAYALCLLFSKLIAYTFLYWLPYYIKSTPIEGNFLTPKQAGDLSTLFDVGGVAGGVMAGHLSDKSGASAVVASSFTLISVPCLWVYRTYGHTSFAANIALMMLSGFFVNGPYALITTAVSADLGTHESLQGNAKALSTVTAIIDGMGSIGAALGPMLTGYISEHGGFDMVFAMLYSSAIMAGLLIGKIALKELAVLRAERRASAWE